jgi:hypothetical protein
MVRLTSRIFRTAKTRPATGSGERLASQHPGHLGTKPRSSPGNGGASILENRTCGQSIFWTGSGS